MNKQARFTSAVLLSLVFLFSGNARADRERGGSPHIRARGDGPYFRDRGNHRSHRTARPYREHRWRGRDLHRDRPARHWSPKLRGHVRNYCDRRWHHRKPHAGPRHHWRHHRKNDPGHHWRPGRYHRPRHFRRPAYHPRWHGHRHAWRPFLEKYVYRHDRIGKHASDPIERFDW